MQQKQGAYIKFLNTYKNCVVRIVERGYKDEFTDKDKDEMLAVWKCIKQGCFDSMVMSINLLYAHSN
jgi:hypothetical protein